MSRITGVQLKKRQSNVGVRRHVHHASETWQITSDIPIECLLECTPLEETLPGKLGTYVYPEDAVFHCKEKVHTTTKDLSNAIETEMRLIRAKSAHRGSSTNHLTVVLAQEAVESTSHDAAEEDYDDEEDEGEDDEHDEYEEDVVHDEDDEDMEDCKTGEKEKGQWSMVDDEQIV